MYAEQIFNLLMLIVAALATALVAGSVRSYWRKLRADRGSGRWCGADAGAVIQSRVTHVRRTRRDPSLRPYVPGR
jgi:hypothetical protein